MANLSSAFRTRWRPRPGRSPARWLPHGLPQHGIPQHGLPRHWAPVPYATRCRCTSPGTPAHTACTRCSSPRAARSPRGCGQAGPRSRGGPPVVDRRRRRAAAHAGGGGLARLLRARPVPLPPRGKDKILPQRNLFEPIGQQQGIESGVAIEHDAEHLVRFALVPCRRRGRHPWPWPALSHRPAECGGADGAPWPASTRAPARRSRRPVRPRRPASRRSHSPARPGRRPGRPPRPAGAR